MPTRQMASRTSNGGSGFSHHPPTLPSHHPPIRKRKTAGKIAEVDAHRTASSSISSRRPVPLRETSRRSRFCPAWWRSRPAPSAPGWASASSRSPAAHTKHEIPSRSPHIPHSRRTWCIHLQRCGDKVPQFFYVCLKKKCNTRYYVEKLPMVFFCPVIMQSAAPAIKKNLRAASQSVEARNIPS